MSTQQKYDVIVVGAGVIGCTIAYRLAQNKLKVAVFDKGRPGCEASRAAAGMLAPHADVFHAAPPVLQALCTESLALYPAFVNELQDLTGINIGYQTGGSICLATDFAEAQLLAGLAERLLQQGRAPQELAQEELRQRVPGITDSIEGALFLEGDHYVNNRELMTALTGACSRVGVHLVSSEPVMEVLSQNRQVTGVRLPRGIVEAGSVINAAGCWAGGLSPSGTELAVRPSRGQMVCINVQPQLYSSLIHSSECYVVPWPDGRVLIGSTLENVGYRNEVTAGGVEHLLHAALRLLPSLETGILTETWAGLRPATPDDLPILGPARDYENFFYATGHFRNGILLAPVTAALLSDTILHGVAPDPLKPFLDSRFK